ncbi:MAG: CRISPR-associated protein Cas4 [Nitrososphaerota archaeon]
MSLSETVALEEDTKLLPVWMIRNYYFCRQEPYINLVLHVFEPETESMAMGKQRHEGFAAQYLPRKIRAVELWLDVELQSTRLGLRGRLDALVKTTYSELIPCEMKNSNLRRGRPQRKDILQLTAYGMLVEDVYQTTVKRGILYYTEEKAKVEVHITQSNKELVKAAMRDMRKMMTTENPPTQRNLRACQGCWYRHICRR